MNNTNDIFITAIQSIAESLTTQQKYDRTIQVAIYNPANVEEREYDVKYQNTLFRVYAKEGETYKTGDTVYVKIPEKDFSQKIYIEGLVTADSELPIDKTKIVWNKPMDPKNSFFFFSRVDGNSTSRPEDLFVKEATSSGRFLAYKKNTPILSFWSLTYYDNNPEENIEFGLRFFIVKDGKKEYISKVYGLQDFSGNPYEYNDIALDMNALDIDFSRLRELIISFSVDLDGTEILGYEVTGNNKISLYHTALKGQENGFYPDNFYEDGNSFMLTYPTPWLKSYGEIVLLNENEAYLTIYTPNGNNLDSISGTKLEGKYVEKGKEIIPDEIQWYKANPTGYSSDVGQGWSSISGATNLNYSPKKAGKYLLFVKKDGIILTKTTDVIGNVSIVKNDNILKLSDDSSGVWTMDKEELPDSAAQTYTPQKTGTVYCQLGDGTILTYEAFVKSESGPNYEIRWQGRECFLYDVDGYSIDRFDEKEWTLRPSVYADEYSSKFALTWLAPDGEELTSNKKYSPKNYALKEMWVDSENVLHFSVPKSLSWYDYRDGRFTLKIKDAEDTETAFVKEVVLIRQGETGTNGREYVAVLKPKDNDYLGATQTELKNKNFSKYEVIMYDRNGESIRLIEQPTYKTKEVSDTDDTIVGVLSSTKTPNGDTITCLYPVHSWDSENPPKFQKVQVPLYVMYDNTGYNPKYNNYKPYIIKKDGTKEETDFPNINSKYEDSVYSLNLGGVTWRIFSYLNLYGNEAINNWDGTSIKISNGSILAPQIGAGSKNMENQFTGVLMGEIQTTTGSSTTKKNGIFGYKEGVETFGLDSSGNVSLKGTIQATGGSIGGWVVGKLAGGEAIYSTNKETILYNSGKITVGDNLTAGSISIDGLGAIGGVETVSGGYWSALGIDTREEEKPIKILSGNGSIVLQSTNHIIEIIEGTDDFVQIDQVVFESDGTSTDISGIHNLAIGNEIYTAGKIRLRNNTAGGYVFNTNSLPSSGVAGQLMFVVD